jgi:hypothetical protein
MISFRVPVVGAFALVLLLAGCSGGPSDDGSDGLPADAGDSGTVESTGAPTEEAGLDIASLDACTILTREDAETLIGTALTDPLQVATSDVSSCTYPGDPNGPTAQVEIYIGPGAGKQLEIERDTLEHPFTEPASIGDEAWQEDYQIFARTGETWVSIRLVVLEDAAGYVTPLQTAMTAALARLG